MAVARLTFRDLTADELAYRGHAGRPRDWGMFQRNIPAGEHRQSAWLTYFSVRHADATVQVVLQHGAKLLFGPRSFPDRGREAVLADPQGAVFAVLASTKGDPPDLLAEPGEWIWSSLITSDPDTAAAFYQALFDYEVFPAPVAASAGISGLCVGERESASGCAARPVSALAELCARR